MSSIHQRQEQIIEELYRTGRISLKELALGFGVSEASVRRDLKSLADDGKLELIHGGAVLPRPADFSFHAKRMRNRESKEIIGKLAADMVTDGEQLFLDSGTTCFQMAENLKSKRGLSIVANSTRLTMDQQGPGINMILLGGQYRPERMDTVGPLAMHALENLRGYRAFIGADGLSIDFGLSASDIESASLFAKAVENARDAILLADHSKFISPSLYRIVLFESISTVVTDKLPSPEWLEFLEEQGIDVVCPK